MKEYFYQKLIDLIKDYVNPTKSFYYSDEEGRMLNTLSEVVDKKKCEENEKRQKGEI